MKRNLIYLFLFLNSIKSYAQKKIEAEAPAENYSVKTVSTKQISNINIPFSLAIADVEKQINKSLVGLIYEDKSHTDNDNDQFKCKVWKKDNILVKAVANKPGFYEIIVPLKIWAEKGIGALGLMTYQSTEFEMKMKFLTTFSINPDWGFQTKTTPNGFDWITKPVLKFGSVEVPIGPVIGKIIEKNHVTFANSIDEGVKANITLKPYANQAWETASKPYLLSEEYKTWLRLTPIEISMMPLQNDIKNVYSNVNLKVYTETYLGDVANMPAAQTGKLPNLKFVNQKTGDFEIALINEVPYKEATNIAKKMFVGQPPMEFQNGKFKVEILDLDIYGSEDKLVIKTEMKGSIKGIIYMKGTPVYDSTKKQIVLQNLDYDLKTKNALVKAANWMLEGKLTKIFEENFGMPVEELINYGKQSVQETFAKPITKGVKMDVTIQSIVPDKVFLSSNSIVSTVIAKGKLNLTIDGMD